MAGLTAGRCTWGALALAGCIASSPTPTPTEAEAGPPLRVWSHTPADGAVDVQRSEFIGVRFSQAMDPDSLTTDTITLTVDGTPVAGAITYAEQFAFYWPVELLPYDTSFVVTVSGARSATGEPLSRPCSWSFVSGRGTPAYLGQTERFAVLARDAIAVRTGGLILGDVGLYPGASSEITGLSLVPDDSGRFATSVDVDGSVEAADHRAPTPSELRDALADLTTAQGELTGRPVDRTYLSGGELGWVDLVPGVYRWTDHVEVAGELTLTGRPDDVWVLRVEGDLVVREGRAVSLSDGASADHVYWVIDGDLLMEPDAVLVGTAFVAGNATVGNGADLEGRILGAFEVHLAAGTVGLADVP